MSDAQWLYLALVLIYAWECAHLVPPQAVAFVRSRPNRWRLRHPAAHSGRSGSGWILAWPWPPLGRFFVTTAAPVSPGSVALSPLVAASVHAAARRSDPANTPIPWPDLQPVRVRGRRILVGDRPLTTTASPPQAARWAEHLIQLRNLPPLERPEAIEKLVRDSLDTTAVRQSLEDFEQAVRPLTQLTNASWVFLLVLAPAAVWAFGLSRAWPALLLPLVLFQFLIARRFHALHRRFVPEDDDERFSLTWTLALSPASALRATDALSRRIFEDRHPAALAKVLLPTGTARRFIQQLLRDAQHPSPHTQAPQPDPVSEFHTTFSRLLHQWARQEFDDAITTPPPPDREDTNCTAYCPRCLAQFTRGDGGCPDCRGVPLVPWPDARA